MDWSDLLAVQGTLKSLLQHHSSKAPKPPTPASDLRLLHVLLGATLEEQRFVDGVEAGRALAPATPAAGVAAVVRLKGGRHVVVVVEVVALQRGQGQVCRDDPRGLTVCVRWGSMSLTMNHAAQGGMRRLLEAADR